MRITWFSFGTKNACGFINYPRGLMSLVMPLLNVNTHIVRMISLFSDFQIENMKSKDKRLKIMNEILNGIKVSTLFS